MKVLCTGISGTGKKEYIQTIVDFAKKKKKKIQVFRIGDMIFEQAKKLDMNITKENVLNTAPGTLKALRSAVFERINSEMSKYENVIVDTHANFLWKKLFMKAHDWEYLNMIKPDLFITIISNVKSIKKNLDNDTQWKEQNLSEDEILYWQNVEVNDTNGWGELYNRPSYVIANKQPHETLFKLMFHPEMEPAYASFPMTHLTKKEQWNKIEKFVKRLNEYFIVFDPRTIEVDFASGEVDYNQTVFRDLYWLVEQSKKIVAIFPEVVLSTGVINELREGFETNKEVFLIFPKKGVSPFTTYFSNKVFQTEDEFFKYIEAEGYKKVKL